MRPVRYVNDIGEEVIPKSAYQGDLLDLHISQASRSFDESTATTKDLQEFYNALLHHSRHHNDEIIELRKLIEADLFN